MKQHKNLSKEQKADIKKIQELTSKHPEYSKTFVNIYLKSDLPEQADKENFWRSMNWIADYIRLRNQQLKNYLPKKITEYESFEEITDDITAIQDKVKVKKKFITKLPLYLRKDIDVKELSNEDIALILNFLEKPRNQFRPPEASVDFNDLLEYIRKRMNELDNNPNLIFQEKLRDIAKKNLGKDEIQLVWDKNNIMVFRTIDPEFIQEFGSHRWCISYAPSSYFLNYVNPARKYTQYIIFNLNYDQGAPLFKIGISLNQGGYPLGGGCQDNFNQRVNFPDIIKDFGIPENIVVPYDYSHRTIQKFNCVVDITIRNNSTPITEDLFEELKDILLVNSQAFLRSVNNDNLFRLFIDNGVNVNIKTAHNYTAMHRAAELNEAGKMRVLIEKDAKIDTKTKDGDTPLSIACFHGNYEAIKTLVDAGADTSNMTIDLRTPLSLKCTKNNIPVIKYFIDNIDVLKEYFRAKEQSNNDVPSQEARNVIKHLLNNGAYPNNRAISNDNLTFMKLFISLDNTTLKKPDSGELLIFAIENKYKKAISFLIRNGIDIFYKDKKGHNAFMKAVAKGQIDTVKALMSFDIDINEPIEGKTPPLILAIRNWDDDIAKMLIENGADIHKRDKEGNTALHAACAEGSIELIELLLEKGASVAAKNKENQNALNVTYYRDVTRLLLKHIDKTTKPRVLKTKQPIRLKMLL